MIKKNKPNLLYNKHKIMQLKKELILLEKDYH